MSRAVSYARQTIDHPNRLARHAHRSRHAAALRLAAEYLPHGAQILDVGAGTGAFLSQLLERRPDVSGTAFEPFMPLSDPGIRRVTALDAIASRSQDVVSAFEVFEHLSTAIADTTIRDIKRVLKPDGHVIISVPIMEGAALPIKEAARAVLFRRASDHRFGEIASGTLGRPVERAADILTSHKGFSHRRLRARLNNDFRMIRTLVTPFPALPWWLNSQFFAVFVAA